MATTLPRLLLFCDFLENRLHTQSLSLLRRILGDFLAGNEHTLQDFMRLGASLVAVMPIEKKGPQRRKKAARLLAEQKEGNVHQEMPTQVICSHNQVDSPPPQSPELCAFRYLSVRVATNNILWLRDMFQEFCNGEDMLLQEFVRRGNQAISVVPVDIQALRMAPLPPPPLLGSTATTRAETTESEEVASALAVTSTPTPTLSPHRKRSRGSDQERSSEGGQAEAAADASDSRARKQSRLEPENAPAEDDEVIERTVPVLGPQLLASTAEMRTSILKALERQEAREPWKSAFNPESLAMPFSRAKYPKLTAILNEFWETHARAVWERNFWSPLSRSRTHELHNQRRCRQSKAQNFFEKNVFAPVHNELGARFYVEMDQLATPVSGWYYLGQAVDLYTMAQRYGLLACLQYIEAEAPKRFPVAPGATRNFFSGVNGKSRSMWSSSSTLIPILDEIVALAAKTKGNSRSLEA